MGLMGFIKRIKEDETGATAVEYGLILSMIVIAMVASLQDVATEIITMWEGVEEKVTAE